MTPNEAFDYVLNEYKVSADEIARISGINKSAISKFRNGKHQMNSGNLQKVVQALPPDARSHFTMLFSFSNLKVAEKKQ
ncbi:MAG: helix-turn-helix transcriptional regulator [Xenococcus sp. MO_188.B8]|nr:helix-turn-helix transcriptional regulator [Xenococcus sp. MO_188.B8]